MQETPRFHPSKDKTFDLYSLSFTIPFLSQSSGGIPVERRCRQEVYLGFQKSVDSILCVPGFASNRHVFDLGGGVGKSGPSLIETLAKDGHDVYSMDLRGSEDSLVAGTPRPFRIQELVMEDMRSVVAYIQSRRAGRVYLLGHSMGGALCCVYASLFPGDVKGIIHVAGLYHYSIPILGSFLEYYRIKSPKVIQKPVSWMVQGMMDTVVSMSRPAVRLLSALDNRMNHLGYHTIEKICRLPIPLKTVSRWGLELLSHLPPDQQTFLLNNPWTYLPWIPYAMDDVVGYISKTVESPTIGVFGSVLCIAFFDDLYRNHDVSHADLSLPWHVQGQVFDFEHAFTNVDMPWWNELGPGLEQCLCLTDLPILFLIANQDGILCPRKTRRGFRYGPDSPTRAIVEYWPEESTPSKKPERVDSGVEMDPKGAIESRALLKRSSWSLSSYFLSLPVLPSFNDPWPNVLSNVYPIKDQSFGHVDILAGKCCDRAWDVMRHWLSQRKRNV